MTILQVCAFSAEFGGNFIASMKCLERLLSTEGIETIYAFSEDAQKSEWCKEIMKRTRVYFLPVKHARILPETYLIFKKIYQKHNISIVHTHFELYDIPATVMAGKKTKIFWHLHDPIQVKRNLRGLLWKIQYGVVGCRAKLISVSDYYRNRVVSLGFPMENTCILLNGIDTNRIKACEMGYKKYDFLTFGWDYYRKGDDLILNACEKLAAEGYHFRFLLNGNEQTWKHLPKAFHEKLPEWLELGEPNENVNVLFEESKCFVQASRSETFSYAVCEAAFSGLPVICSRIAGVEWAKELPTVSFFSMDQSEDLYLKMKSFLEQEYNHYKDVEFTREIILKKYSSVSWAENVRRLYFE